jgi:AraC family transcriptional activator of tynA and feaB
MSVTAGGPVTVWDVTRLPERDQFAYWHEVICQAFVPLTPRRARTAAGFPARVETRPLADVNRARISSQPQATHHGPREVAATDGAYFFVNLQLAGRCRARQGSAESVVEPGQFVLVDTTRPFYFDFDAEWQMLSFRVPHEHLLSRLAGRTPRTGVGLDGRRGVGGAVGALMTALWQVDPGPDRASSRDLEQSLASAVVAATAARGEGPPIDRTALRVAVLQHVRDHLTDRALSVSSVARRFAVSPRTLHNAFAEGENSFGATVRALRLDTCAALLADPDERRTVTDIAAAHGFEDPTSFSRAFRRRFDRSPRDLRRSVTPTADGAPADADR